MIRLFIILRRLIVGKTTTEILEEWINTIEEAKLRQRLLINETEKNIELLNTEKRDYD